MRARRVLTVLATLAIASCNASTPSTETSASALSGAASITWDGGGGDGLWSNPLNWSGDALPGPGASIVIDDAGIVHVDVDTTVGQFRFGTPDPSANPVADHLFIDA